MDFFRRVLARDAGLTATRRALRAAIVMPSAFAVAVLVLHEPAMGSFAAFGSLATVLFVEFGGPLRDRVLAQIVLILAQLLLIVAGTLAGQELWAAVPATLVVVFVVLLAGVVSSALASATTTLLLAFVLPVTLSGSVHSLPLSLAGWAFAGALSLIAITVLWPSPARDPLRGLTSRACALLGRRLRAEVEFVAGGRTDPLRQVRDQAVGEARGATEKLRSAFFGAPYRPSGLGTATRAVLRLIDESMWLETVLERTPPNLIRIPAGDAVRAVKEAAADLLERAAGLLEAPAAGAADLGPAQARLQEARAEMERSLTRALPLDGVVRGSAGAEVTEFVTSLEPSFRALEMSVAVAAIAGNVEIEVAARRRTWLQQMLGHQADGSDSAFGSARDRLASHLRLDSIWLHNSLRGAIGIALAVLIAEVVGAQHTFWVVFGTLAVLRSNALNTGQNALRAVLGTALGVAVGALLVLLVGTHTVVFWVLLPVAVLVAGLAPAMISFAAGQAAFTVTLVVLYNLLAPVGWQVGLVRIEDVALGAAVSVVVGFLFWPRGASNALGRMLSEALTASSQYLRRAVDFGVTRCDRTGVVAPLPVPEQRDSVAAARRLDDAFREFLAERGRKAVPLAEVTTLLTAVTALRLTGDAVLDLWQRDHLQPAGDRTAARNQIRAEGDDVTVWYEVTARALAGRGNVPDPLPYDAASDRLLVDTVRADLSGADGQGTSTAVRMIWTADHLDAARRLQAVIVAPARKVAAQRRRPARAVQPVPVARTTL